MRTYEETIREMAAELRKMRNTKNGDSYNWMSTRLSGKAEIVAYIYGKDEKDVCADIIRMA